MTDYEKESMKLWDAIKDDVAQDVGFKVFEEELKGASGGVHDRSGVFIVVNRDATPEEVEEVRKDDVRWSAGEKLLLSKICSQEPPLKDKDGKPYRIRSVTTANGHVAHMYHIPLEERVVIMQRLWPFYPVPEAEDKLFDIHSEKTVLFRECGIIRWNRFNLIVAPDYLNTGGMVVDLQDVKDKEEMK